VLDRMPTCYPELPRQRRRAPRPPDPRRSGRSALPRRRSACPRVR
jgi:hypothetical protein